MARSRVMYLPSAEPLRVWQSLHFCGSPVWWQTVQSSILRSWIRWLKTTGFMLPTAFLSPPGSIMMAVGAPLSVASSSSTAAACAPAGRRQARLSRSSRPVRGKRMCLISVSLWPCRASAIRRRPAIRGAPVTAAPAAGKRSAGGAVGGEGRADGLPGAAGVMRFMAQRTTRVRAGREGVKAREGTTCAAARQGAQARASRTRRSSPAVSPGSTWMASRRPRNQVS